MMIYDRATEIQHTVANDAKLSRHLRKFYQELQSGSIDMARQGAVNVAKNPLEEAKESLDATLSFLHGSPHGVMAPLVLQTK
eukprot:8300777-Alexandrium_andersonii.AAC.1